MINQSAKKRVIKVQPLTSEAKLVLQSRKLPLETIQHTPNIYSRPQNTFRTLDQTKTPKISPIKFTGKLRSISEKLTDAPQLTTKRLLRPIHVESQPIIPETSLTYEIKQSARTRKGVIPSQPQKINQDQFLVYTSFFKSNLQHFYGIFDGHGTNGHKVSQFAKMNLPHLIQIYKQQLTTDATLGQENIFKFLEYKLTTQNLIDTTYSGSTVLMVYVYLDNLYCANIGDSRAILGSYINGTWDTKPLSRDHKPSDPNEEKRIVENGGRVQQLRNPRGDYVGPMRVWLRDENIPGLAMSRSLGDKVATSVGVYCEPDITHMKIKNTDRIVVLGSDGLFEFMANEIIVDILSSFYEQSDIEGGCDELLKRATLSWTERSNFVDDITFIVLFLYY